MSDPSARFAPKSSTQLHSTATLFRWPVPPFPDYAESLPQLSVYPCEILGLNGSRMSGTLLKTSAEERTLQVLVPPARSPLVLRFAQFKALKLLTPIPARKATEPPKNDPFATNPRPRTRFQVALPGKDVFEGETIGHHQTSLGLFFFEPLGEQDDTVQCVFIPHESVVDFDVGERIGDLLIKDLAATADQIEAAVREQTELRNRRVGDILRLRQIVTAEQLMVAIEQQIKMPMVRIGEALLAMELVTVEQLEESLLQQKQDRTLPLGELLVRKGVVTRAQLQSALARKMGYPVVDVDKFDVDAEALRKLPLSVARRLEVLPLVLREGRVVVAMEDPSRRDCIDEIEFVTQLKVSPVLARVGVLKFAIPAVYDRMGLTHAELNPASGSDSEAPMSADKLIQTLEREELELVGMDGGPPEENAVEQSDNSLVRLINSMISEAYAQGVSDIHVESYPGREKVKIRFRKDGQLQPYLELPHTYRSALVARIKVMCDLDISERRKPQDGKINFARFMSSIKLELRVATIPTSNGLEDVVLRLLASAKPLPMDKLGLSPYNFKELQKAVGRPYGMVLCVGPTGSGKTTTLHSVLAHINTPDRKIWTAEDPVEITQAGLRQVQVNPKIDWTFARALRAFLRADPDVIMVGEIRDQETAEIAVEASLTGHLVMSTLHTNSAPETITRLLDMGMDPFNFADSLLAVLAQRLVRRLCSDCVSASPMDKETLEELAGDYRHIFPEALRPSMESIVADWRKAYGKPGLMHYHSSGCAKCEHTGYRGRAGLHELLVVSKDLRRMIQTGGRAEQIQHQAMSEGMRTLRQDGITKVLQGITSLAEVRATSNQ
ncbi:ATPase, T2SS/T4P/T4SS family [Roseateles sp. BYS180W]|uniref:ATPase, T2SS/T4P/T4SS family n=1 Tax=Roseateles rivi TaxID=3299028 RepID=A0ABW7FZC5_9BURK